METNKDKIYLIMKDKKVYLVYPSYLSIWATEKGWGKSFEFPSMKPKRYKIKDEVRLRSQSPSGYSYPLIKVDGVLSFPAVRKIEGKILEELERREEEIKKLQEEKQNFLIESFGFCPILKLEECYDFTDEKWRENLRERVKRILERTKRITEG